MFSHYLKVIWRQLAHNKVFSLLKIGGLAVAFATSFLLFLYVNYEFSFDQIHPLADDTYRVELVDTKNGVPQLNQGDFIGKSPRALGPKLLQDIPEVLQTCRIHGSFGEAILSSQERKGSREPMSIENFYYVDSSFFEVFSYTFLEGNAETVFQIPKSIILTESVAKRYFDHSSGFVGKTVEIKGYSMTAGTYQIGAIIKDPPPNSHLQFPLLMPIEELNASDFYVEYGKGYEWEWRYFYTYVSLKKGTRPQDLTEKLQLSLSNYNSTIAAKHGEEAKLSFVKIGNLHFGDNSEFSSGSIPTTSLYFLILIGVLIFLIAGINFVNLTLSGMIYRLKEVGVRKVMGVKNREIFYQFTLEFISYYLIALVAGGVLLMIFFPYLEELVGQEILVDAQFYSYLWAFGGIVLLGAVITIGYPAFRLMKLSPIQTLKGSILPETISAKSLFSDGLTTVQFVISICLLSGTLVVLSQLDKIQERELGFDMDRIILLKAPILVEEGNISQNRIRFENELEQHPTIVSATNLAIHNRAGESSIHMAGYRFSGGGKDESFSCRELKGGYDLLNTYGIKLKAGRMWYNGEKEENRGVIINEAFLKYHGLGTAEEALTVQIANNRGTYPITGVVEDFLWISPKETVEPLIITNSNWYSYLAIKVAPEINIASVISQIEETFFTFYPGDVFSYAFQDDFYNQNLNQEERLGKLLSLFSFIAIFLACLGLLGIIIHYSSRKQKEISIRKILGASVSSIFVLLSKRFVAMIMLAAMIGFPLIYWSANEWLADFAIRIEVGSWFYLFPLLIIFSIVLATMAYHLTKLAFSHPAEALRVE
ncbi:MAG: FtsX-like permease family protein [Bacteroidota bacterium]